MRHKVEENLLERAELDFRNLKQLYELYFPKVYAYVRQRVNNNSDAEDITSEIFLKAAERINTFEWRYDGAFKSWIFSIAHNTVSNHHRMNRYRKEPLDLEASQAQSLVDKSLSMDEVVVQKEQFAQLYFLLNTLSPRRQEVITLKFFGELRNQEIAEILNLDERTVASHLCRGLEDLHRKYLAEMNNIKERGQ